MRFQFNINRNANRKIYILLLKNYRIVTFFENSLFYHLNTILYLQVATFLCNFVLNIYISCNIYFSFGFSNTFWNHKNGW